MRNPLRWRRFRKTMGKAADDPTAKSERIEIYKLMVEMADRVSQRRQAANSFYLSLNTLLVGGAAYLETTASLEKVLLISVAGILISIYWIRSIESYKTLNTAKFAVINEIESRLVESPFSQEWKLLDPDRDGDRHKPFHRTERLVPKVFIAVYVFQLLWTIPWTYIILFIAKAVGNCS